MYNIYTSKKGMGYNLANTSTYMFRPMFSFVVKWMILEWKKREIVRSFRFEGAINYPFQSMLFVLVLLVTCNWKKIISQSTPPIYSPRAPKLSWNFRGPLTNEVDWETFLKEPEVAQSVESLIRNLAPPLL